MPFHFLASLGPFEIELRVVELDVRPHQVGDNVRHDGLGCVFPIGGMMIVGAGQSTEPGIVARMAFIQVPFGVGFGNRAAFLDYFVGRVS